MSSNPSLFLSQKEGERKKGRKGGREGGKEGGREEGKEEGRKMASQSGIEEFKEGTLCRGVSRVEGNHPELVKHLELAMMESPYYLLA
jgi:hypothetical protein